MILSRGRKSEQLTKRDHMRNVEGYVVLTLTFSKDEDGTWLAECKELSTTIQANTFEEAKEIIDQAILMHINEIEDVGETERFFKENDINFIPEREKTESVMMNIPLNKNNNQFVQPYIHHMLAGAH